MKKSKIIDEVRKKVSSLGLQLSHGELVDLKDSEGKAYYLRSFGVALDGELASKDFRFKQRPIIGLFDYLLVAVVQEAASVSEERVVRIIRIKKWKVEENLEPRRPSDGLYPFRWETISELDQLGEVLYS